MTDITQQNRPAEPDPALFVADGFGQYAKGGVGGDVVTVTNLNDSGSGSLRDAIENATTEPRLIDFSVGGTITLASKLSITNPNITINGASAPNGGIIIKDYEVELNDTHDIILRHLRFRSGNAVQVVEDSLQIFHCNDIVVDHCSMQYAVDENLDVQGSTNVTVQWCIIALGLMSAGHAKGDHSMGLIGFDANKLSIHHNLFAHNDMRSPFCRQDTDVYNNVIYNWGFLATDIGYNPLASEADPLGTSNANVENNYYILGPDSDDATDAEYNRFFRARDDANVYIGTGNRYDVQHKVPSPPISIAFTGGTFTEMTTRFSFPRGTGSLQSADDAYVDVLDQAGAFPRDSVDHAIVQDVKTLTGAIIDAPP